MLKKTTDQLHKKDYVGAENSARSVIKKQHNHYQAHNLLGIALQMQGKLDDAIKIFKKAMKFNSKDVSVLINLSNTLTKKGELEESLKYIEIALNISPHHTIAMTNKAYLLRHLNRHKDAIGVLENIVKLEPSNIKNILQLAEAYYKWVGDNNSARNLYNHAYSLDSKNPEVLKNMCTYFHECYHGSEIDNMEMTYKLAKELMEVAEDLDEMAGTIQAAALSVLDHQLYERFGNISPHWTGTSQIGRVRTLQDRLSLISAHKHSGKILENTASGNPITHMRQRRVDKKIRLGFLSADFRQHPVGYFAWPAVKYLDKTKFDIYCYVPYPYTLDDLQFSFMKCADKFHICHNDTSRHIAQTIANDQVDVLIDLAGYTVFNRIDVFAYKPAPIQISWLGYPHPIGLSTIDYMILDPYLKPNDSALLIEKPLIMPKTWVALDDEAFITTPLGKIIAEDKNGYITFGTFNSPYKITKEAIETWASIMLEVENSRFIYMRPESISPSLQENFYRQMEANGIHRDRISFVHIRHRYRAYFNYIDIALDTFPHTGGTTTCESIWMGIPVITLIGESMFERISFSNLSNAGLSEFCARDIQEYKSIAVFLAKNKDKRNYLLRNLRAQIKEYPLGQPEQFGIDFCNTIKAVVQ